MIESKFIINTDIQINMVIQILIYHYFISSSPEAVILLGVIWGQTLKWLRESNSKDLDFA